MRLNAVTNGLTENVRRRVQQDVCKLFVDIGVGQAAEHGLKLSELGAEDWNDTAEDMSRALMGSIRVLGTDDDFYFLGDDFWNERKPAEGMTDERLGVVVQWEEAVRRRIEYVVENLSRPRP